MQNGGRDRSHQLVAAHPDVTVDPVQRQRDVEAPERPVPGDRVVVVRVDERAVDVEDGGGRHPRCLPDPRSPKAFVPEFRLK